MGSAWQVRLSSSEQMSAAAFVGSGVALAVLLAWGARPKR